MERGYDVSRDGKDDNNYNVENYEFIKKYSPTVGSLIEKEYNRQKNNIELIASENYCSEAVLAAWELSLLEVRRRISVRENFREQRQILRRNGVCG